VIRYHYLTEFKLDHPSKYTDWVISSLKKYDCTSGAVEYIFCSDENLLEINKKHLNHDYYTDIITFQYEEAPHVAGDIYISLDRVKENAQTFGAPFQEELRRVMIHGVLHLIGFQDSTDEEKRQMRELENELLNMFHVKQ
jgi:rRNA maturation RNase YbeY